MGMFGMGGEKKSGVENGDWGSDMVGMMKMLAGMPHMMRKPMMKGRTNQILSLSEESRQQSIRDMMGAFHSPKVKEGSREKLIATRIEVVGQLTEERRRAMITSRVAALKDAPELEQADRRVQDRIMNRVPDAARHAFATTFSQVTRETTS